MSAGSTGNVRDLSIVNVDKTHDIEQFWMRFMTSPLVNKPGMITAKRSTVMSQLQASHTVDFHSSDSGPIKIENSDSDYDSQVKLQDALEQASQYGQPSKDHNNPKSDMHIPSDEVLGFFGTKFPEELYTKLQHLQNDIEECGSGNPGISVLPTSSVCHDLLIN
ncbi:hypothetical protein ACI3LX_002728 [Candidozyma auris]